MSNWLMAGLAGVLVCVGGFCHAAPPDAYGALPTIDHVTVSPDGTKVAYAQLIGAEQIIVVDSVNPPAVVGGLKTGGQKLRGLVWADSTHLLIIKSTAQQANFVWGPKREWSTMQSFDLVSRKATPLLQDVNEAMNVILDQPQTRRDANHTLVYVTGFTFVGGRGVPSLFWTNVATGKSSLVNVAYARPLHWIVDARGVPIAGTGYDEVSRRWSLWMVKDGRPFEAYGVETPIETPDVVGVSADGSALVLRTQDQGDVQYRPIALDTGVLGPVLQDWRDFAQVIEDPATHRIIGGRLFGDRTRYRFFRASDQAAWDVLVAAFKDEDVELQSWSDDRSKIVVRVTGPTHGVAFELVDMAAGKAMGVGDAYAGLRPTDMARVEAITYKAADGLDIPAFLTLPNGRDAKGLPLVVLPHGGPAAQDATGFDWWAQALASRGYAVLQPEFRGSDGYGWNLLSAGFGQWGRKMQTDLSDGVRDLSAKGLIDPKRVCIVGASYGGYAALAGATLDPGVYRCAASIAGLSDLHRFLDGMERQGDPQASTLRYWNRFMGSAKSSDPALNDISPAKHVDKVSIPILLIHGKDDTVVPIQQSQIMADALTRAGKPVEFITLPGEDHWLSRSETRQQMLQATVRFLEANNPPG